MLASILIGKKRDGVALTKEEIEFLIYGYVAETIPDYQMSAWAMAVYLRGMNEREVEYLTDAMIASGDVLKRSSSKKRVDKHSTGGLGDKTSIILAPLLAEFDLEVPMISGRGLGITGGTLDKLEAIEGFRTNLSEEEIQRQVEAIGCVITGASARLVPADRKLYGLRDVTATVPSIPLITASIMSKKLAESLDCLVLDVKWGTGAFMQQKEDAIALARSLVRVGERMKVATSVVLSDMNQPLGKAVGNGLEINESYAILRGEGPEDARFLTIELAAQLLMATGKCTSHNQATQLLQQKLDSGDAWERFCKMVEWQGGRMMEPLPVAPSTPWKAPQKGFVTGIDGQLLGQVVIELGGGRRIAGEKIDPTVGLTMHCRIGDQVDVGQTLIDVHSHAGKQERIDSLIHQAIEIQEEPVPIGDLWEVLVPGRSS